MSEHNYLQPVNNHFNNDDDVDDDEFLANSRTQQNPKRSTNPFDDDVQVYEQKRKEIEDRTLQASNRSLGKKMNKRKIVFLISACHHIYASPYFFFFFFCLKVFYMKLRKLARLQLLN